jgi:Dynein heavy chain, N-terminal region 2
LFALYARVSTDTLYNSYILIFCWTYIYIYIYISVCILHACHNTCLAPITCVDHRFAEQVQFLLELESRSYDLDAEIIAVHTLFKLLSTIGCFSHELMIGDTNGAMHEKLATKAVQDLVDSHTALTATLNTVHKSMSVKRKYFTVLLKDAFTCLHSDVSKLEAQIESKSLIDIVTNPTVAVTALRSCDASLQDIQARHCRYLRFKGLLHNALFHIDDSDSCGIGTTTAAAAAVSGKSMNCHKSGLSLDEHIGLDIQRVVCTSNTKHTMWSAVKQAHDTEHTWLSIALEDCDIVNMQLQLVTCKQAYTQAVTVLQQSPSKGMSNLLTLTDRILDRCTLLLTVIQQLHNRNITPYYWHCIEAAVPDMIDVVIEINGKRCRTVSNAASGATPTAAAISTDTVQDSIDVTIDTSSLIDADITAAAAAAAAIAAAAAAQYMSSSSGHTEATTRSTRNYDRKALADLAETDPMAFAWGNIPLLYIQQTICDNSSATTTSAVKTIAQISAEATASAIMVQTLNDLDSIWLAVPLQFDWCFDVMNVIDTRSDAYANSSQTIDDDADNSIVRLLSNGKDMLELVEHCLMTVNVIVNAPQTLLAAADIRNRAVRWHLDLVWFQQLLVQWDAVQSLYVRLSPVFNGGDVIVSLAHDCLRYNEVVERFVGLLTEMQTTNKLVQLSANQDGGRNLLSKVIKVYDDFENMSHQLQKWLDTKAMICPRLLSLPGHELFRLCRQWCQSTIQYGTGNTAQLNVQINTMFPGIGELVYKPIADDDDQQQQQQQQLTTTKHNTANTHGAVGNKQHAKTLTTALAASDSIMMGVSGIVSSGQGLETILFERAIAIHDTTAGVEMWLFELERKLITGMQICLLNTLDKLVDGTGWPIKNTQDDDAIAVAAAAALAEAAKQLKAASGGKDNQSVHSNKTGKSGKR